MAPSKHKMQDGHTQEKEKGSSMLVPIQSFIGGSDNNNSNSSSSGDEEQRTSFTTTRSIRTEAKAFISQADLVRKRNVSHQFIWASPYGAL